MSPVLFLEADFNDSTDVYLDHAGATIPSKRLIADVFEELQQFNYGNPHSIGKYSGRADSVIREARSLVLEHFNTNSTEYEVIFTSGTTAGIKLIGECFPWSDDSCLCYPTNSHTSLLGLRGYAPNSVCVPSRTFQQIAPPSTKNSTTSSDHNDKPSPSEPSPTIVSSEKATMQGYNLLAVPGECNFSGAKADISGQKGSMHSILSHSGTKVLNEIDGMTEVSSSSTNTLGTNNSDAGNSGDALNAPTPATNNYPWLWLLDAAKLAATSPIDLSAYKQPHTSNSSENSKGIESTSTLNLAPHFVVVSFYKIFGYPTGLGALLVRRDALPLLKKRYYGGGTLLAATASTMFQVPKSVHSHSLFEDGTVDFYGIAATRHGFAFIKRIGGMQAVKQHTCELTRYLVTRMHGMRHSTIGSESKGGALCEIFGRHFERDDDLADIQGPIISFTLSWANGEPIGFAEVERLANENNIQMRTGCFCNVGGCQEALGMSADDAQRNYAIGRVCSDSAFDVVNGKHTGAVRVSLGISSTMDDCDKFLIFLSTYFLNKNPQFNGHNMMKNTSFAGKNRGVGGNSGDPDGIISGFNGIEDICLYPVPSESADRSSSTQHTTPATVSSQEKADAVVAAVQRAPDTVTIAAMYVYPIKSCAGMRVASWPLSASGFLFDRHWALIDSSGKAITQKMYPRLALVQPQIDLETGVLFVRAPGMNDILVIPVSETGDASNMSGKNSSGGGLCDVICAGGIVENKINNVDEDDAKVGTNVNICGELRHGRKVSSDADRWFSAYLSQHTEKSVQCSFVKCVSGDNSGSMKSNKSSAAAAPSGGGGSGSGGGGEISFANTAQFLLLSAESVRSLIEMIIDSTAESADNNADTSTVKKGDLNIKVENFRPNILVSVGSGQPHQEDSWSSLTVPLVEKGRSLSTVAQGNDHRNEATRTDNISSISVAAGAAQLTLNLTGPCSRCSMVNVNGISGAMDCRAFQALAGYRKKGSNVYFGQFLSYDLSNSAVDVSTMLNSGRYWLTVDTIVSVNSL